MMQQNTRPFILTQKQKQLLMKATLMTYLNQSILRLYQTYKNILEMVQTEIADSMILTLLIIQSTIHELLAVISNFQKSCTIRKKD